MRDWTADLFEQFEPYRWDIFFSSDTNKKNSLSLFILAIEKFDFGFPGSQHFKQIQCENCDDIGYYEQK